jgi:hypothetical protein
MSACKHAHGEYGDDYRRCTDCGREWVLISGEWFQVEAWVRISTALLAETEDTNA